MFKQIKMKLKEKYRKDGMANTKMKEDCFKDFLNNVLSNLEKLLAEEAKLKQMAEDKRREINKAIEELETKVSLFKVELEKIRFQFKGVSKNKEMEKEQIEGQLCKDEAELIDIREDGGDEIKSQQEDWGLRLQSKEEENNLLKNRIAELEEQLQIEREKKGEEIDKREQSSEEMSGGQ